MDLGAGKNLRALNTDYGEGLFDLGFSSIPVAYASAAVVITNEFGHSGELALKALDVIEEVLHLVWQRLLHFLLNIS